jgi:hypothetical protein
VLRALVKYLMNWKAPCWTSRDAFEKTQAFVPNTSTAGPLGPAGTGAVLRVNLLSTARWTKE